MSMTTEELVARRVTIAEQIDRLTQEKQMIDDHLREAYDYGNNDAGDWTVQVQRNRRLDTARIEQRYPVAQYPHLYEAKVSTGALKDNFSPLELEKFYVDGAAKIMVK